MSDTREQNDEPRQETAAVDDTSVAAAETAGSEEQPAGQDEEQQHDVAGDAAGDAEAEVLRDELKRVQEELSTVRDEASDMKDRYLRARADLENYRKRAIADADRARDAGMDSAMMPILTVYDDLQRALEAAETGDPASIVPGVQSVLATLERNLDALGIERVGEVGEKFDPDLHEALTTIRSEEPENADTIANVFQVGFRKGDRLVRPARVVVYQNED